MSKQTELNISDRVKKSNLELTSILYSNYRKYFWSEDRRHFTIGSTTYIREDNPNIKRNALDKGMFEVSEQEHFNRLDEQLLQEERAEAEQRRKVEEEFSLQVLLPIEIFEEENTVSLSDAMRHSAVEILMARERLKAVSAYMKVYEESLPATVIDMEVDIDGNHIGKINIKSPKLKLGSLIGSTAIHARNALDYIAWGLISKSIRDQELEGNTIKGAKKIMFPYVNKTPDQGNSDYNRSLKLKTGLERNWISQDAHNLLISDQPFLLDDKSEEHPLSELDFIVSGYKHRTLVLTNKALHGYHAFIEGTMSGAFNTIRAKHGDEFILQGNGNITPSNLDTKINLIGGVDIAIQGMKQEIPRMFLTGSKTGFETIPKESSMEVTLHEIIKWVESIWIKFEGNIDLFTEADAR